MSPAAEWKPEEIASFLRGIYEDKSINELERSLYEGTWPTEGPPGPNTCHPALSHAADFVRGYNKQAVRIMSVRRGQLFQKEPQTYPTPSSVIETNKEVLTRSKACGPAPFIGDPRIVKAVYVWPIWSDRYGRHISGDAELVWGLR